MNPPPQLSGIVVPPGSPHKSHIVLPADKLAEIESAPDIFAGILGDAGGDEAGSDREQEGSGTAYITTTTTTTTVSETKAPEPDFMRFNTPSSKPRYASDEDDGDSDLDDRLPLMARDDQELRRRRKERGEQRQQKAEALQHQKELGLKAQRDAEHLKHYRTLRTRKKHQQWQLWSTRIRSWLETVLPESFTKELSLEAGVGKRWAGVERVLVAWNLSRRAAYITAGVVVGVCLLWWVVLPTLFGGWLMGGGGLGGYGLNADGTDPRILRIDGHGAAIHLPLPLCDLLYRRADQAKQGDARLVQVANKAATRIRKWWSSSGPPISEKSRTQRKPRQPRRRTDEYDDGDGTLDRDDAFRTLVPDHHSGEVWAHLKETGAVRSPALGYYPEILNHGAVLPSSPSQLKAFEAGTREWLKKWCRRGGAGDREGFAQAATQWGALEIDVSDYVPPLPPAVTEKPQQQEETRNEGTGADSDTHVRVLRLEDLLHLEDDGPSREPEVPQPEPAAKVEPPPVLALPPPVVKRNISVFELHVLMGYLAKQAAKVAFESETAAELEQQLGNRVAQSATAFCPVREPNHSPPTTPDPWLPIVRDQLARLERERDPDLLLSRAKTLWNGQGGCVCAHHVGVPIPGASWYEPARPPELPEDRWRVLFYPTSDAAQEADSGNPGGAGGGGAGALAWRLLRRLATSSENDREADPAGAALEETSSVSWYAADPVLGRGEGEGSGDERDDLIRMPPSALSSTWTWVEGIDFRGNKRRYRASPRSLACVLSCLHTCG